jgi:peptidyl-prolyl cis-trans isomerase D
VAGAIEKLLVRQEAAKLAAKDGEAKLALLNKGDNVPLPWGAARFVSRATQGLPAQAARAVFASATGKFPAYAGLAAPGGYVLFRISQVKAAAGGDDGRALALKQQFGQTVAEEEFTAWLATLRSRYTVEINQAALETKQQ